MQKKAFVMDSAMILNDFNFFFPDDKLFFTTSEIVLEIKDFRSKQVLQQGFDQKALEIRVPSHDSIKKVEEKALSLSLLSRLSLADVSIVALALDFGLPLISDDHSIHKLCKALNIRFLTVLRKKGK